MGRRSSTLNLLTFVTLAASGCVVIGISLLFLAPGLVPGLLRGRTEPAAIGGVTARPATTVQPGYPTLPPEWTATPTPLPSPSRTADRFPTATQTTLVGPGQTNLPNLNGTAQAGTDARVSADVITLPVRALAGTAGTIVANVPALTPLRIIGRLPDNSWLQVVTPNGTQGWAQAESLDVYVDLLGVPVTGGAALQASPTPPEPTPSVDARVKLEGDHLRLRQTPGTAGTVIAYLPAQMDLHLLGRTDDNIWLQVITSDNQHGWVMTQYVDLLIGLDRIPVTGTAVNGPPATQPAGGIAPTTIAFVPTLTPIPTSTSTPSPTNTSSPTPTDTPIPPTPTPPPPTATNTPLGDYHHPMPYITGIDAHARQIYLAGLVAGNRANVFSKIGDSITVAPPFLLPFGGGKYNLRDYGYLGDVVTYYSSGWARNGNSFNDISLAAKGGWSSLSVLSPPLADHSACRPGESPLLCEFRLSRPSVALIMLGTNDVMGTSSAAYQANLQRIVDDAIGLGIVPVLSTIPAFHRSGYTARVQELNGIVAAVAHQSDIPLWDYWAAMEGLPNEGLSPDGIHPSEAPDSADFTADNLQFGYAVRNLTALQALDALWHLELH